MNESNRTFLIILVALLLLVAFMPWGSMGSYGGGGWGWCGMMQRVGYTSSWTSGLVGWMINIALIILVALAALWLLRDMSQEETSQRKKRR